MLTFLGILFAAGILLGMFLLFMMTMRIISQREKRELEQITGGQHHA